MDLHATGPVYETTVFVRGNIILERTLCMNEEEASTYLRARFNEILPLSVRDLKVVHKTRPTSNSSLWESEFLATGKVHIDKPMPREEIRKLVQDIVQRAGFEPTSVEVRRLERSVDDGQGHVPSNRELVNLSSKAIKERIRTKESPIRREEAFRLKKGDRIIIHRLGTTEEAVVRNIVPEDQMAEVSVESYATPVWVPFGRIVGIRNSL